MTAVYLAKVNTELSEVQYASLPPERRAKADALRKGGDRRLSAAAWLLLARAVSDRGLEMPRALCGENGKPYFPTLPQLHFNLSHAGDTVMCVLGDKAVGCDVQVLCAGHTDMAKRYFHPRELELLASVPEPVRDTLFCRIWSAKESVVKLTGEGVSQAMRRFFVDLAAGESLCDGTRYYIKEINLDGYAAFACTAENEKTELHFLPNCAIL